MNQRNAFTLPEMVVVIALVVVAGLLLLGGCARMQKSLSTGGERGGFAAEFEADADPDDYPPPVVDLELSPLLSAVRPVYDYRSAEGKLNVYGRLETPLKRRWDYIVIHHSFTRSGSEAIFDRYHKQKGWLGVGYDFVIGNGNGSPDGAIEVTFRWETQIQGAHAGVDEYNQHGIGICLVGDFENGYPTPKQMDSLVGLVNYLQERCHIPTSHLLLHRNIKSTRCPGRNFPLYRFLSLLEH